MPPLRLQNSEGKFTRSREIEPARRSFCRHGSFTFTEAARLVPSVVNQVGEIIDTCTSQTTGDAMEHRSALKEKLCCCFLVIFVLAPSASRRQVCKCAKEQLYIYIYIYVHTHSCLCVCTYIYNMYIHIYIYA